jgi:hypothetical protein
MQTLMRCLAIIGILVVVLGVLVIFNDWLRIPFIAPLSEYGVWFIAIGLLVVLVIAGLFFSRKAARK